MKISHTDRLGVWVFVSRTGALKPWCCVGLDLVEAGLLGVCVGVMWAPRRRQSR